MQGKHSKQLTRITTVKRDMKKFLKLFLTLTFALAMNGTAIAADKGGTFTTGNKTFLLNGKPFIVKAAEIHYPRIPRAYWEHRIKMCKALGMNTICIYIFWNIHEQQEGVFNFNGNNDIAAFCRMAQKNGMYVIVRPGPYVCAEWEMGGLPWWLLKKKDIKLREQDPYFMERVKIFEKKVGEQLAQLTIQNGGPIIMVQVENEYGSYGVNKPYVSEIRDCLRDIYGKELTLFQCDWASNFERNGLDDLVWTMNFGTGANIDSQFKRLSELRPNAPKMCSEFWSGWFDKWGARHETRPAKDMVAGLDEMLSKGISFSLYMTHGGTSFGHWAGANSPGFAPDVTSYDYDAPINEYGQPTPKYYELRKMMEKYSDGKKLPAIPKTPMPLISVPKFKFSEFSPLRNGINKSMTSRDIKTMEELDMGWGSMIYTAALPKTGVESILRIDDPHDYAQVFINDKYIGTIDRVKNEKALKIPAINEEGAKLTIVVEAMGRINFGRAIKDFKGITDKVTLNAEIGGNEVTWNIKNWTICTIPDDYATTQKALSDKAAKQNRNLRTAGYYRGYFNIKKVGDTFINMEAFGKGQVYVNGHALGRFWNIGPQQTLYLPGCWLKKGRNEVIVLDVVGAEGEPTAFCQDHPELDKLNIHRERKGKEDLNKYALVKNGTTKAGNGWQTLSFGKTVKARYVAIVAESTHDGGKSVAIAELYAQDADGKRLSREPWTLKDASSEDLNNGNNTGDKVYDLQESTFWKSNGAERLPQYIVIDLGTEQNISAIEYLPRAEKNAPGSMKDYKILVK